MKKTLLFAIGVAAALFSAGCRTASMEDELQSVSCAGYEPREVINAVEQVVESRNFQSRLSMRYGDRPIITIEDSSPDSITLAWRRRGRRLRFRYGVSGGVMTPEVLSSDNFYQDGDRLHRGAIRLLNELTADVSAALAATSAVAGEEE